MRYAVTYEIMRGDISYISDLIAYITVEDTENIIDHIYAELCKTTPRCFVTSYVFDDDEGELIDGSDWF